MGNDSQHIELQARQCLFEITANNGRVLSFSCTDDGECAIMRDGEIVDTFESSDSALRQTLKNYFRLVEDCGGSRHPFQALEPYGHLPAG